MERFQGQCLQIILDSIELPIRHILKYIYTILCFLLSNSFCSVSIDLISALSYCHSKKLLHLDVKPQNVLVELNGFPAYDHLILTVSYRKYICKLCDFGSSMKIGTENSQASSENTKVITGVLEIIINSHYDIILGYCPLYGSGSFKRQ